MKLKTTKQLIQEIVNRKNAEANDLGLQADWTAEYVMHVAIMNMHERVVGGGVDSKCEGVSSNES